MALLAALATTIFFYRTRRWNGRLRKINTDLDKSNLVKDKIFAVLGHDLRSPLISILNFLAFIEDDDIEAQERHLLVRQLSVATGASLDTLDGLLKWGELQIKGISMRPEEISVKAAADQVITLLGATAALKSISITNQLAEDLQVWADLNHFRFVLRNLLVNAIKFTPAGGKIWVALGTPAPPYHTAISVNDNGVGIAPEKLTDIFQLHNVSSLGTSSEKGTSLGLHLCQEFITANKGRIRVESVLGRGSVFTVEFIRSENA